MLVTVSGGVDVMLSPDNPVDGIHDAVDPSPVIDFSRQLYDATIVDSSGAYGDWNLSLAQLCDEVLMVTTNELSALQAAQRAISYLERHQVPRSKIRLVVNRYNCDLGLSREVIETALHMDVFHLIPSDYEAIQAATLEGKQAGSNTVFGKQIAALAELMTGKSEKALQPKKASAFAGVLSFFSKKPAVSR
jgi:Flp pilus assembly CpaE family ATPase